MATSPSLPFDTPAEEWLLAVERVSQALETREWMTAREISRLFTNQRKSYIEPGLHAMKCGQPA